MSLSQQRKATLRGHHLFPCGQEGQHSSCPFPPQQWALLPSNTAVKAIIGGQGDQRDGGRCVPAPGPAQGSPWQGGGRGHQAQPSPPWASPQGPPSLGCPGGLGEPAGSQKPPPQPPADSSWGPQPVRFAWKHITTLPTSVSTSQPREAMGQLPHALSGARTCESVCARRAPRSWRAALPQSSKPCRNEAARSPPGPLRVCGVETRGVLPPRERPPHGLPDTAAPCPQPLYPEPAKGPDPGLQTLHPPRPSSAGAWGRPSLPGDPPCLRGQQAVARTPPSSPHRRKALQGK